MRPSRWAATGARIFDGQTIHDESALLVEAGRLAGIVPAPDIPPDSDILTVDGGVLAPGFVDLQVNGGGGVMFNDAPSVEALGTMSEAHAGLGTLSFLPTLITDRPDITRAAIAAARDAIREGVPGIAGLHLEGPHLSIARKGAHSPDLIRPMGEDDMDMLLEAAAQLPVLYVTIAPENVTPAQMRRLAEAGIILSLGHSDCSFETACEAAENGVRCVTHLFNAMSQIGNRAPGLVGAALARPDLSAGIIADFVHVHPAVLRMALAAKRGPGQIFLVTDAMAPAGTDCRDFTLNGRVIRREGGRLTLADGTLAGADLDLATAIGNVRSLGVEEAGAIAMATSIPAAIIRASDRIGALRPGRTADFLHLDGQGKLAAVWRGGVRMVTTAGNG